MLRKILEESKIVLAPGAGDPLMAIIMERLGFPVVYVSGSSACACILGLPDLGLATMTEMTRNAGNIASVVTVPVIADADTGYGDSTIVGRAVREFEKAGIAGIHIEDQVFPKRCGFMEGLEVIPKQEMVEKIKAATEARTSSDFVIIARTDAREVNGFADAIDRLQSYIEAGADGGFMEGAESMEEVQKIPKEISAPMMIAMNEEGPIALAPLEKLQEFGYKIVIYPTSATRMVVRMVTRLFQSLKEKGTTEDFREQIATYQEYNDTVGSPVKLSGSFS